MQKAVKLQNFVTTAMEVRVHVNDRLSNSKIDTTKLNYYYYYYYFVNLVPTAN